MTDEQGDGLCAERHPTAGVVCTRAPSEHGDGHHEAVDLRSGARVVTRWPVVPALPEGTGQEMWRAMDADGDIFAESSDGHVWMWELLADDAWAPISEEGLIVCAYRARALATVARAEKAEAALPALLDEVRSLRAALETATREHAACGSDARPQRRPPEGPAVIRDYPKPAAPFDILPELVGFGRSNVVDLRWYALSPHQILRAAARAELARRARMEAKA